MNNKFITKMNSIYQLEDFLKDLKELVVDENQEYKYEKALHRAINNENINFCKTLIDMGLIKNINYMSDDGDTLLIAISRTKYDNIITAQILIDKGADINLVNRYGSTALIIASIYGNIKIVKLLLENKADINVVNLYHNTALKNAVISGHKEITTMLVDNGADVNIGDDRGFKPIDCTKDEEIKKILTKKTSYKYIDASGKEYPKLEQEKDAIRMICCVSMDVNTIEIETGIIETDELMVKIWNDNKWICQKMNLGGTIIELPKDKNLKIVYHVMTEGTIEKIVKIPGDAKIKISNETIEMGSMVYYIN